MLGESADLVRAFFTRQLTEEGGGCDREGRPDLYYTIFALAGLQACQAAVPQERTDAWERRHLTRQEEPLVSRRFSGRVPDDPEACRDNHS